MQLQAELEGQRGESASIEAAAGAATARIAGLEAHTSALSEDLERSRGTQRAAEDEVARCKARAEQLSASLVAADTALETQAAHSAHLERTNEHLATEAAALAGELEAMRGERGVLGARLEVALVAAERNAHGLQAALESVGLLAEGCKVCAGARACKRMTHRIGSLPEMCVHVVQVAATPERMLQSVSAELLRLTEHNACQEDTLQAYGACMAHHCMRVDSLAADLSDTRDALAEVRVVYPSWPVESVHMRIRRPLVATPACCSH